MYSYILFEAHGLLPQTFNTYLIRNILIYPGWRTHHIEEYSSNMYRDNPNRESHELRLWHRRVEDTTSRVSSRGKLSTPGPPRTHTYMLRIAIARYVNGGAKPTKKSKTYGDNSYKDICYFPVWYWQVEHKSSRVVLSMHMNTLSQPITGNHWFCLSCPNFQPKDSIFTWEVPIKPNKTQFPRKVFEGCGCLQWHQISVFVWAVPTFW